MMKIPRRTITAVCLATLMTATSFSTITPFPQTTITAEAASTITTTQAGKKIAKAQDKAFNTKKDVTVTVKVKCPSKKKADSILNTIEDVTARTELGDAYNKDASRFRPSMGVFQSVIGKTVSFKETVMTTTTSLKGGVLTYKMTIHGGKSAFQKAYRNNVCLKQNVADLKKRVEGMDEKDKAWEVAVWLNERVSYNARETNGSDEAVYKKQAYGVCADLAILYLRYALLAGVEKPGIVLCQAEDHDWNCVKIDGETYYLDMQDSIDIVDSDYDWLVENIDSTDEKIIKAIERAFDSDNLFITTYRETGVKISKGEYCLQTMNAKVDGNSDYGKPSQWKYKWRA